MNDAVRCVAVTVQSSSPIDVNTAVTQKCSAYSWTPAQIQISCFVICAITKQFSIMVSLNISSNKLILTRNAYRKPVQKDSLKTTYNTHTHTHTHIHTHTHTRKNGDTSAQKMKFSMKDLFSKCNQMRKNCGFGHIYHGTIIRTEIACKKIPCYMRDSTCRWFIVKKCKIFWSYVKHFWILLGVRKFRILIGLCK